MTLPSPPSALITDSQLAQAADILKNGGLVAFPTETVYGLGANAEDTEALGKLYTVKGRPGNHPVIVHLASLEQLQDWAVEIPEKAWQLAKTFWPGPLTLILKRSPRVPDAVTGGQDTVGIRIPNHPVALALLNAFQGGIAAPSANRFGRLSPTSAAHVRQDLESDVDLILDGGECQVGVESTIVAFQNGQPVILRPGMITAGQIQAVLRNPDLPQNQANHSSTVSRAPGTLASHYAPRTPLKLLSESEFRQKLSDIQKTSASAKIGALVFSALQGLPHEIVMPKEPTLYAQRLYADLRKLDGLALNEIWVEAVPDTGAWAAVADRLHRAAAQD